MSDSDSISDSESASDLESDYEEVSHYMTLHFDMPEEYKDVALENYQLTVLAFPPNQNRCNMLNACNRDWKRRRPFSK